MIISNNTLHLPQKAPQQAGDIARTSYPVVSPGAKVSSVVSLLSREPFAVVLNGEECLGVLTLEDTVGRENSTVRDCLGEPWGVESTRDIATVMDMMELASTPALPVFEDGRFTSVIVQNDIIRHLREDALSQDSNGGGQKNLHDQVLPRRDEFEHAPSPFAKGDLSTDETNAASANLIDLFRKTTGMDIFIVCSETPQNEFEEKPLLETFRRPRICQIIQSSPEGRARCMVRHERVLKRTFDIQEGLWATCHAGLTFRNIPAFQVGAGPIGIRTTCGVDHCGAPLEFSALLAKLSDLHLPEQHLATAFAELPKFSGSAMGKIEAWMDIILAYLPDIVAGRGRESSTLDLESEARNKDRLSLEELIRDEVSSCALSLPPMGGNRCSSCSPQIIKSVMHFLYKHYSQPVTNFVVADALGFEPSYFAKVYKRHAGGSMVKHLRALRLSLSKQFLEDPYLSVSEISTRLGFSEAAYFTRVFRAEYGITPTEYREEREGNTPPQELM